MMREVISSWIEEGFSNYNTSEKRDGKQTIFPLLRSESNINVTPRPLFPAFLNEVELDSSFLVECLEIIQDGLSHERKGSKETHSTTENISTGKSLSLKKNAVKIDYERKNIFLSSTIFPLFEMADTYISNLSFEFQSVLTRNNNYKKALEYHQNFPSDFREKSTLTGNIDVSEKQIETTPISLEDKSSLANAYLMEKYYDRKETDVKTPLKTFQQFKESRTKFREPKEFHKKLPEYPEIMARMETSLYIMEKALDYNTNEKVIVSYNRNIAPIKITINSLQIPKISEFSIVPQNSAYQSLKFYLPSLENKYSVSCIECNWKNPCIFICGYSMLSREEMVYEPRGIVLCWSINKCGYPERIYHFDEDVTCCHTSKSRPYLVAVGMQYGLVAVIDLRQPNSRSYITNQSSKNRSVGTIKSVQWMIKKHSLGKVTEILFAVSVDGIITSWNYKGILDGNILTAIKKQNDDKEKYKKYISNTICCTCMDSNPNGDIFAVGTIEGKVFIVGLSNPNEYLVRNCHFGSVNYIKWSPMVNNVFFTCGTDRCLHIWELNKTKPSKTLILPANIINIALSSMNSTLFSALTNHKLYIYDLAVNLLKPIIEINAVENMFTSVHFCTHNDWFFEGGSDGRISLFKTEFALKSTESSTLRNIFLPEQE